MWVEKNKSGSYKYSERYKDPLTGKLKKVTVSLEKNTKFTAKKAQTILEAKIQKRLQKAQDGSFKQGVTLGQVIDEWEPIYKSQVKPNTFNSYPIVKKHIGKYVGFDTLVAKINDRFIIQLCENLLYKENLSNVTVRKIYWRLNAILRFAYKRDYVNRSPQNNLDINWKKDKRHDISKKFLEDSEAKAVLNYVYQHNRQHAAIFEWQYLTGMRIGETLGMQVKNIYQNDGNYYAKVTGTIIYTANKISDYYKQDTTKTISGMRSVLLPARAVEIYLKWSKGKKPNDYLFMYDNQFFSYTTLNNQLRNAKKFLGIDKELTTHTFRHTHVSKLAELGIPLYIIEDRIGHANSATIRNVYLHVTNKAKTKFDNTILKLN
ncbi:integrase [Limosilactobacillus coleohominis DSM 14060]|nr:integrase [Limosilactobacillus coleohominis DSM 14060]